MAGNWDDGSTDQSSQSEDSYHVERSRIEPIYDSFICPLTKQIMRDPVSLENGQTFERSAIERWFRECRENGRRIVCPATSQELRTTDLNPSIALRNTIEQWDARNMAVQLDMARKSLSSGNDENDTLQSLKFIQQLCLKSRSNKPVIRQADLIPMIAAILKSSNSRRVRCRALETLRIVAEDDPENKEIIAEGDTVRTIVKFLPHERSKEREEAVSLLYELSKSETLCEKIGSVQGAILILVGMSRSNSENLLTVEKAEQTMVNLAKCESNVRQMAENGRLQPLLSLLLEGPPETKLSMAAYLGELVLNNDIKVIVARTVGSSLINIMRSNDMESREAALKALNQISSYEASAKVLIAAGILPPLIRDLFTVGPNKLPVRLKEVSATILANLVSSDYDFSSVPVAVGPGHSTLVSEDTVHKLLYLINNTGPAIECKLFQVLVGLTSSQTTVLSVVSAVKSSGATISLVQFIEAPQRDLRAAAIKLLQNLSTYMGQELTEALLTATGQLGTLVRIIMENNNGITEEQASAVSLLAELPERDTGLTRQMLAEDAFEMFKVRLSRIRNGETSRFVTVFQEGLVRVLSRVTYVLSTEPQAVAFCCRNNLASDFIDLLQSNGLDKVQLVSATALENLSLESRNLSKVPDIPRPGFCVSIFPCLGNQPGITGLCKIHHGICSLQESFCLLEGQAVKRLVALLDHANEKVVEASLAALCTLLEDGVNIEEGVMVLLDADGVRPILDILIENRTDILLRRSVWAVERMFRFDGIAMEVGGNPNVSTALVDAFQNADNITRQIAERALRHIDRIPNFSGIFNSFV